MHESMATIPPLFLLLFFLLHHPISSSLSDSDALLLLKSSFRHPVPALSSWSTSPFTISRDESSTTPCAAAWTGVLCFRGIVTGLRLAGLGLQGTINIDALFYFPSLRSVSFNNNNFTGPLPDIGRLNALKSVYLSNNRFSGPINDSLFSSMDHLKKLWLDGNLLSGKIPTSLSKVSRLMELHLEGNGFTGAIPVLQLPSLRTFNVSNNDLQALLFHHFGRLWRKSQQKPYDREYVGILHLFDDSEACPYSIHNLFQTRTSTKSMEKRVFYMKMKVDFQRYVTEVKMGEEREIFMCRIRTLSIMHNHLHFFGLQVRCRLPPLLFLNLA